MKKINFKNKKNDITVTDKSKSSVVSEASADYEVLEKTSLEELQKVTKTINKIKKQNSFQAFFANGKNQKALAENQEVISGIIKNILNWLAVITSAEVVRKDEYDSLANQLLQLDEDVNEQLNSQVKFKKAYQNLMKQQELQNQYIQVTEKMKKENLFLKIISASSIVLAIVSIIISAS